MLDFKDQGDSCQSWWCSNIHAAMLKIECSSPQRSQWDAINYLRDVNANDPGK